MKTAKKIGLVILFPALTVAYLLFNAWQGIKVSSRENDGRVTKYNPYTDKW